MDNHSDCPQNFRPAVAIYSHCILYGDNEGLIGDVSPQHVNLDYLNLHLADYELDTEAFVTFCLRQLQALRAFITDPPIGPSLLTLGRETPSFLEDLHLVGHTRTKLCVCMIMTDLYLPSAPIVLPASRVDSLLS